MTIKRELHKNIERFPRKNILSIKNSEKCQLQYDKAPKRNVYFEKLLGLFKMKFFYKSSFYFYVFVYFSPTPLLETSPNNFWRSRVQKLAITNVKTYKFYTSIIWGRPQEETLSA